MGKETGFVLNRKKYIAIKKYDHNQMSTFLANVYQEGYKAGKKETGGLSIDELKEVVINIKGIGEKKAADIISVINHKMNDKNSLENN